MAPSSIDVGALGFRLGVPASFASRARGEGEEEEEKSRAGARRSRAKRALASCGALIASALPIAAHDHWIAPSSFRPAVGERLDLRLCVGHPGEYEEQLRDPRRALRFELHGPSGTKPILGLDGRSPAGFLTTKEAGLLTLVYLSNHAFVEIGAEKYAEYLAVEGLEEVQAERERRGETALPGRDSYLRCDKALVHVGDGSCTGFERTLGLPIELVLETDPGRWSAGQELTLRLEFGERPLANRQVKLMRLAAPHTIVLARTDEHGRTRFTPESAGAFVASSVHQRRATPEQALEGDWEGFWASLSFELAAR